ncbi:hypothetical protein ACLMJK_005560 [Lecanora helva]
MASKAMVNDGVRLILCSFLLLLWCSFTSAGILNWRQGDAEIAASEAIAAATGSTTTDAAAASTQPASTSASASVTGTEASPVPTESAATSVSNSTSTSNTTSTAGAAATSSLSSSLNSTTDPHGCHIDLEDTDNPFCKPPPGQKIEVDKLFEGISAPINPIPTPLIIPITVQWDPNLFSSSTNNTIKLVFLKTNSPHETDENSTINSTTASNSLGSTYLSMSSSSLNGSAVANLSLILENTEKDERYRGPTLLFEKPISTSPSSHSKKLGEEVGIPIGLVFLIAAVALVAAFLCIRKRRHSSGGYGAGGKGARSQRMAAASSAPNRGSRGHRRDPSFHDEPTKGGMELQNRNSGLTGEDNWDWGSPVSSPTSAGGGRGSNAFRDEIQRQRSGKRA